MNRVRTATGDIMYVSEYKEQDVTYGVISIKLKQHFQDPGEAQHVLVNFMQQLQPAFAVQHSAGVFVSGDHAALKRTVVDYWQDADKKDWKVKGWTDGQTMAVLYIKNISALTVEKEDYFLNGSFLRKG